MATPGFKSAVLRAGQLSTPFTNSLAGGVAGFPFGQVFQINTPAQRLLDPSVATTVQIDEGGGWLAPAAGRASVDYLFGVVRFNPPLTTLNCRVSGAALNLVKIFEVSEWSIDLSRAELDATVVDEGDFKKRIAGLMDAKGSLKVYTSPDGDAEIPGDQGPNQLFDSNSRFMVSIQSGSTTPKQTTRLWARLFELDQSVNVDDKVNYSIGFSGSAVLPGVSFSRFVD